MGKLINTSDEIFGRKYFEKLYNNIMDRIDGRTIYIEYLCMFKEGLSASELKRTEYLEPNFIEKLLYSKERESLYYKELFENRDVVVQPILIYVDGNRVYREVVTGCAIPKVEFDFRYRDVKVDLKLGYMDSQSGSMDISSTNFGIFEFKEDLLSGYMKKAIKLEEFKLIYSKFIVSENATKDVIDNYISKYSNENNYMQLIDFFFSNSEKVEFNQWFDISPIIADDLVSYYKKMRKSKKIGDCKNNRLIVNLKKEPKLDEPMDKSFVALDAIIELRSIISNLSIEAQAQYYEKLDDLIRKYDTCTLGIDENSGCEFQTELYKLRAEVKLCEKKTFNYDLVDRYFNYFYNVSKKKIDKQDLERKMDELFRFINYFISNKKSLEFSIYDRIQELIFNILTNVLIFNPSVRESILREISSLYQNGIRGNLSNLLNGCLDKLDINDPDMFSITSLSFVEMDNMDYIVKALEISDKLDRELILDIINQRDSEVAKRKIKSS